MFKRTLIVFGLFACWSCSQAVQETAKSNGSGSAHVGPVPSGSPEISINSTWQVRPSEHGNIAWIESKGVGPNGEIKATLLIQCPAEKNPLKVIKFIVHETGKIPSFDFDSFEGPDALNQDKKLLQIAVDSNSGKKEYTTSASGWYGGSGEPDAFVFAPGTIGNAEQALVSKRGKVSFKVSDTKNNTLEANFPELDPTSETASILKGCRESYDPTQTFDHRISRREASSHP